MRVTRIKEFNEDTTMTLRIIEGETSEGTIVTERQSIDKEGETIVHVTLETPSTEDQVYRTLEELAAETNAELNDVQSDPTEEDTQLLDEIVIGDPESDALELQLMGDD